MKILHDEREEILYEGDSGKGRRPHGIKSQQLKIEVGGLLGVIERGGSRGDSMTSRSVTLLWCATEAAPATSRVAWRRCANVFI